MSRKNAGHRTPLQQLWDDYDGLCWLCDDYVDLEATDNVNAPTRDHVIPFAQRDDHGLTGINNARNLRLAHVQCNTVRGNPDQGTVAIDMLRSRTDLINRKPI